MQATFEKDGTTTPETRAAIMSEMLKFISALSGETTFSALYSFLLKHFAAQEEQIGGDIYHAYGILALAGLVNSNDADGKGNVSIGAGTTVGPAKRLTYFIWSTPADWVDEEEATQ